MFQLVKTPNAYSDRFDLAKFMPYGVQEESYDVLNSQFLYVLKQLKPAGEYVVNVEEAAPDLIAFNLYGDERLWWVIMYYNDLDCFQEVVEGVTIRFPSYPDLENTLFSLRPYK